MAFCLHFTAVVSIAECAQYLKEERIPLSIRNLDHSNLACNQYALSPRSCIESETKLRILSQPARTQILVVGGGPGGSYAAATLALEGFQVSLLEATKFPRSVLVPFLDQVLTLLCQIPHW